MFFVIVFGVPWLLWKLLSSLRECSYPPRVWYPVYARAFVSGSYKARNMHLGIVHGNHTSLKRCNLHHIYYITVMVIKVVEVRYTVHILDMCVGQLRYKLKASSVNREVLLKEAEVSLRRLNLYVCFWKFPVAPLWWGFRSSRALSAA